MYVPVDTQQALASLPPGSRSLYFDRFARPDLQDEERQSWFEMACKVPVPLEANRRDRAHFYPGNALLLHGQLQARLLLNMSGGVMENAGLCLDRYGLPYIPGSAVKGCARRAALYALREWTMGAGKPDDSDVCFEALQSFDGPEAMLHRIALCFGWVEKDWTDPESDFRWAALEREDVLRGALRLLGDHPPANQAGGIAFFAAYPNTDPGLELDILTCHHQEYYGNEEQQFAPDTEQPIPVTFPAVRAQSGEDHFTFALSTLRGTSEEIGRSAQIWLTLGLEIFGLGAKTAAGHGWFEVKETTKRITNKKRNALAAAETALAEREKGITHDVQSKVRKLNIEDKKQLFEKGESTDLLHAALVIRFPEADKTPRGHVSAQGHDWFADAQTIQLAASALLALKPEITEEIDSSFLTESEKMDRAIANLTPQQFDQKIADFCKKDMSEKEAIVRALRGARGSSWAELKQKAERKPKQYTQICDAIRSVSKALNLGRMP
jgi:CRISPR-associated protein Cmr6